MHFLLNRFNKLFLIFSLTFSSFLTAQAIDIMFNSDTDIAGFQFNIEGATVNSASGGAAGDAGFTVSAGGSTVLGFSFSGASIPAGSGILTTLNLSSEWEVVVNEDNYPLTCISSAYSSSDYIYMPEGVTLDECISL